MELDKSMIQIISLFILSLNSIVNAQGGMDINCKNAANPGSDPFMVTLESDTSSDFTLGTLINAIIKQGNIIGYGPNELLISHAGQDLTDHKLLLADIGIGSEASIEFKPDPFFSINQINIHCAFAGRYAHFKSTITTEISLGHDIMFDEIARQVRENPEVIAWISQFEPVSAADDQLPSVIDFIFVNENFNYKEERCMENDRDRVRYFKLGSDIHAHYYSNDYVVDTNRGIRVIAGQKGKINKYMVSGLAGHLPMGEITSGPYYLSDLHCHQYIFPWNQIEFWYDSDELHAKHLHPFRPPSAVLIEIDIVIKAGTTIKLS